MSGGGTITNAISASITGCYGIVTEAAGTVINNGAIADTGTGRVGVFLDAGGYLANGSDGLITGVINGVLMAGPGTVPNEGFISATGSHGIGVDMVDAGPLINAASGFIIGAMLGVTLDFGGTLVNAGTIAAAVGSTGTAVSFGGTIFDRLVLDPASDFPCVVVAKAATPAARWNWLRRRPPAPVTARHRIHQFHLYRFRSRCTMVNLPRLPHSPAAR